MHFSVSFVYLKDMTKGCHYFSMVRRTIFMHGNHQRSHEIPIKIILDILRRNNEDLRICTTSKKWGETCKFQLPR